MTLTEAKNRIQEIKEAADRDDYERAHGLEDALYSDFIEYMAGPLRVPWQARLVAGEIMKTKSLDFPRYTS